MGRSNQFIAFALLAALGVPICQGAAAGDVDPAIEEERQELKQFLITKQLADYSLARNVVAERESPFKRVAAEEPMPVGCESPACDESCVARRWIVEMEAVWLAPLQGQQFGSVAFASGEVTTEEFATQNDASFTLSPRIALGVQGECWGLIGRYWRLQTGDLAANLATITGSGFAIDNGFRAETADLEVTRLLAVGKNNAELRLSFGARYAQLSEAAGVTVDEIDGFGYYRGAVFSRHDFSGAGLTAGLRGIRPIGCRGFHLFVDGRVSILWDADEINYVATRAEFLGVDSDAHSFHDAISASINHLFIGEIQLGGQWNLPLECVPANAFVRMALEYQYWGTGISGGAEAFSGAGPLDGPLVVAAGSSSGATHVNLLGFSVATGLTW